MTKDDDTLAIDRSEGQRISPTTVRLTKDQLAGLQEVEKQSGITRSKLICLAVSAMIDHVGRTGKLLLPQKPKQKRPGHHEPR